MDYLERNTKISLEIANKLKENTKVEGIMFLGGVARKFADIDSDIDIAVFSNEKIEDLPVGENVCENNIDIEIFNIHMDKNSNDWSQQQKEAYAEGYIAFDRRGLVKKYINQALNYTDQIFQKEYVNRLFELAWHGYIYTPYRNKYERGYKWILPNDLWYKRNNPQNGFYILQKCAEKLIEMMFVINRKWIPDFKWILIKVQKLSYLPKNFYKKISYVLFSEFNDKNWNKKIQYIQEILDESFEYIEKFLPENLYELVDGYE